MILPSFQLLTIYAVIVLYSHGGKGAAMYAGKHIVSFIESTTEWNSYISTGCTDMNLIQQALVTAFQAIDAKIRIEQDASSTRSDISGCTANTAIITPTHIVCANAGDSRCVLASKRLGVVPLSFDHKPNDELEKKRIEAAGGTVHMKRVDGDLAVSRTFGDFAYKQRADLPASEQKVSNIPDTMLHKRIDTEDEFLVLACDGLWDVFSNEDCVSAVRHLFQLGESNPMLIAEEVIDMALEKSKSISQLVK